MKVKQLLERLSKMSPDDDVFFRETRKTAALPAQYVLPFSKNDVEFLDYDEIDKVSAQVVIIGLFE